MSAIFKGYDTYSLEGCKETIFRGIIVPIFSSHDMKVNTNDCVVSNYKYRLQIFPTVKCTYTKLFQLSYEYFYFSFSPYISCGI